MTTTFSSQMPTNISGFWKDTIVSNFEHREHPKSANLFRDPEIVAKFLENCFDNWHRLSSQTSCGIQFSQFLGLTMVWGQDLTRLDALNIRSFGNPWVVYSSDNQREMIDVRDFQDCEKLYSFLQKKQKVLYVLDVSWYSSGENCQSSEILPWSITDACFSLDHPIGNAGVRLGKMLSHSLVTAQGSEPSRFLDPEEILCEVLVGTPTVSFEENINHKSTFEEFWNTMVFMVETLASDAHKLAQPPKEPPLRAVLVFEYDANLWRNCNIPFTDVISDEYDVILSEWDCFVRISPGGIVVLPLESCADSSSDTSDAPQKNLETGLREHPPLQKIRVTLPYSSSNLLFGSEFLENCKKGAFVRELANFCAQGTSTRVFNDKINDILHKKDQRLEINSSVSWLLDVASADQGLVKDPSWIDFLNTRNVGFRSTKIELSELILLFSPDASSFRQGYFEHKIRRNESIAGSHLLDCITLVPSFDPFARLPDERFEYVEPCHITKWARSSCKLEKRLNPYLGVLLFLFRLFKRQGLDRQYLAKMFETKPRCHKPTLCACLELEIAFSSDFRCNDVEDDVAFQMYKSALGIGVPTEFRKASRFPGYLKFQNFGVMGRLDNNWNIEYRPSGATSGWGCLEEGDKLLDDIDFNDFYQAGSEYLATLQALDETPEQNLRNLGEVYRSIYTDTNLSWILNLVNVIDSFQNPSNFEKTASLKKKLCVLVWSSIRNFGMIKSKQILGIGENGLRFDQDSERKITSALLADLSDGGRTSHPFLVFRIVLDCSFSNSDLTRPRMHISYGSDTPLSLVSLLYRNYLLRHSRPRVVLILLYTKRKDFKKLSNPREGRKSVRSYGYLLYVVRFIYDHVNMQYLYPKTVELARVFDSRWGWGDCMSSLDMENHRCPVMCKMVNIKHLDNKLSASQACLWCEI